MLWSMGLQRVWGWPSMHVPELGKSGGGGKAMPGELALELHLQGEGLGLGLLSCFVPRVRR